MKPVDYNIADISTAEWTAVFAIVALAVVMLIRTLVRPRRCDDSCDNCALSNNCRKKKKK